DAARQPYGRHGGFGSRADQTHFFDGWNARGDGFGDFDLALGGRAERQTVDGRFLYDANDVGMGVAQNGRPPGTDVIDVSMVFGVPDVRALRALDKAWHAAHRAKGAHGRIDAA